MEIVGPLDFPFRNYLPENYNVAPKDELLRFALGLNQQPDPLTST